MSFLLDTCVISELVRPVPDKGMIQWIESRNEFDLYLSVLTLGEIQKGISRLSAGKKKSQLTLWLKDELEVRFAERVLPVTDAIALMWGDMLGTSEKNGQPLSVIDALIAATATVHNLVLVTRNITDFSGCSVDIVDPWSIP
ncbi:MAG: type II toxin-antitoxin system VapC family toxin [Chlorobium sp.]|uniref:type II toxin-antitoxin system VapC family toxin n=1 Tax=Chlorobium sp. TaxID=1095 RepID=UPI0025C222C0|nr:type II toxin-antitoxin system VapC family toxin [Chlorobium sp.]MCF8382865.1 type II toxin-antitoxin system VapC family toxin [Chlorobium sp.]